MTNTSITPLSVDGVRLDTLAYNIETLDGRLTFPGLRGENPVIPGADGSVFTPNKDYEDGAMTLSMWVRGADVDGTVPTSESNRYSQFRTNIRDLSRMFAVRHRFLDVRQTWPGGVIQYLCTVEDSFDFSISGKNPMAKFAVILKIPKVFGQDVNTTDYSSATGLASGVTLTLATYDGGTAPISDAVIAVRGPLTNPRLTNPDTGEWVQLNAALASGTDWYLNCATWDSRSGSAIGLGGGGTNQVANTQYGGGGAPFMRLTQKSGGPQLVLTGTGAGGATQVLARARRKFLL